MKFFTSFAALLSVIFAACSDAPVATQPTTLTPVLKVNLQPAAADGWLYYSFDLDSVIPATQSETDLWDIKFRRLPFDTTAQGINNFINVFLNSGAIFFNSGTVNPGGKTKALVIDSVFDQLTTAPQESLFRSDDTASADRIVKTLQFSSTIFAYSGPPNHACTFKPNKTIVLRTRSNRYVKLQLLSIYKDAPENPNTKTETGYYRFRYVKADGTRLK